MVKLSGRIFNDVELIRKYIDIVGEESKKRKIVLVSGGGDVARRYISILRSLGGNEAAADMLGIAASRLNAMLMVYSLLDRGIDVYPLVPESLSELAKAFYTHRVVVMGGLQPGQSTTMVSVLAAEYLRISVVANCSNIDALYTDDPSKNPNATRISKATVDYVSELLKKEGVRALAGTYELIDEWALSIMKRSRISMIILDGKDPVRLSRYLENGEVMGTVISPE